MSKSDSDADRERAFVVIARTGTSGKKYEDCKVIPHGDPFIATHSQVFGPASQRECEKWMHANCAKSGAPTK